MVRAFIYLLVQSRENRNKRFDDRSLENDPPHSPFFFTLLSLTSSKNFLDVLAAHRPSCIAVTYVQKILSILFPESFLSQRSAEPSRNRLSKVYIFHEFFSPSLSSSQRKIGKDQTDSRTLPKTLLSFSTKSFHIPVHFSPRIKRWKKSSSLSLSRYPSLPLIRGLQTLDMVRSTERSYTFAHGSRQISHVSGDGDLYPWLSRGRIGRGRNRPSATFFTLRVGCPSCRLPLPFACTRCVYVHVHNTHTPSSYEMALS